MENNAHIRYLIEPSAYRNHKKIVMITEIMGVECNKMVYEPVPDVLVNPLIMELVESTATGIQGIFANMIGGIEE